MSSSSLFLLIRGFSFILAMVIFTGCGFGAADKMNERAAEVFDDPQVLALARAGAKGDVAQIDSLLAAGANINGAGKLGITPAWWAAQNKNKAGYKHLLVCGANPSPIVKGLTILEMVASYEDSDFLKIALRFKPDLNQVGQVTRHVPIYKAISNVVEENVRLLIEAGADLNFEGTSGNLPIIYAARLGRYDFVLMMIKAGADPAKLTESRGHKFSLAETIGDARLNPDGDLYVWRERVIALMRAKGIVVNRPTNEGTRTKPLPDDVK